MKKVFGLLLAAVGVAAGLAGCSTDATDPYPSADSYCSARADAECAQVAASCGATVDACKTKRKTLCTDAATKATSAGRAYASSQVQGCIDKTKEIYAKRNITPDDLTVQNETCEKVFAGSIAKGKSCTQAFDCAGGLICDRGVCAEKSTKSLGDGCANPGEVCATGSFCGKGTNDFQQCLAKKTTGEACSDKLPCNENTRCGAGVCVDRLGPGQTCTVDLDCGTQAPLCDPGSKKCAAGLQLAIGTATCKEFGGN